MIAALNGMPRPVLHASVVWGCVGPVGNRRPIVNQIVNRPGARPYKVDRWAIANRPQVKNLVKNLPHTQLTLDSFLSST